MSAETKAPDAMHFKLLRLENVRGFASAQTLQLVDEDDRPSRWNLILGENGVGKTTLMEALRVMQPVPAALASNERADQDPPFSKALLSALENRDILHFVRKGEIRTTEMNAVFETAEGKILEIRSMIKGSNKELKDAVFPDFTYSLSAEGPLVIIYDAGRHVRRASLADDAERETIKSPLLDTVALADAQDILEKLDYKVKSGKDVADERLLERIKTAVAQFGFNSSRTREAEEKLAERLVLIRTPHRSADQEARLQELDNFVASLPTAHSPSAHRLEELMMDFVKNFPRKKAQ